MFCRSWFVGCAVCQSVDSAAPREECRTPLMSRSRRCTPTSSTGGMRSHCEAGLCVSVASHVASARLVGSVWESHRELYNAALAERRDAWERSKTRIRYVDQSGQLTDIRSVRPDHAVWSFSSQQATF